MSLQLYNNLSRQLEPFQPAHPERVTMYVCGPTVYNYVHIGNARGPVVFGVLAALLRRRFGKLRYARNITDVDDKINAAAGEAGVPISAITERFASAYREDMAALGVEGAFAPDIEPAATDHIAQIIAMCEQLIVSGHAYAAEGHVLFSVASFQDYGKLSRRNPEDMLAGARVEVAPYKRDPGDFVLWKPSSADLPGWDSPWGRGRPGWHIECSAMGQRHLGNTIDIHGGGSDLIFPHHEAEIMQMEGLTGQQPFCQVWMHTGMVALDGVKMSKSLGNLVFLADLLESCHPDAIRALLLSHHYRQDWTYTPEALAEAQRRVARWHGLLDGRLTSQITPAHLAGVDADTRAKIAPCLAALDDDLNTPAALDHLDALADAGDLNALLMAGGVMGFFMPKAFNAVAG